MSLIKPPSRLATRVCLTGPATSAGQGRLSSITATYQVRLTFLVTGGARTSASGVPAPEEAAEAVAAAGQMLD